MRPEYVDIHAHLNFSAFDEDREAVLKRTLDDGVWVINVGTQKDTSRKAVEIAKGKVGVFAAIGLHPIHTSKSYHDMEELGEGGQEFTSRGEQFDFDFYKELGADSKVVAIGECGLDYFRADPGSLKNQEENFIRQIELANSLGKPLMLHIRNAYSEALKLLKQHANVKGNVHFFTGNWDEAKSFFDIGFSISFSGVITFVHDYDQVVKNSPMEMIMADTDSPYVAPRLHRGNRNEPIYVKEIFKTIASLKNQDSETVRKAIVDNAVRLFGLE